MKPQLPKRTVVLKGCNSDSHHDAWPHMSQPHSHSCLDRLSLGGSSSHFLAPDSEPAVCMCKPCLTSPWYRSDMAYDSDKMVFWHHLECAGSEQAWIQKMPQTPETHTRKGSFNTNLGPSGAGHALWGRSTHPKNLQLPLTHPPQALFLKSSESPPSVMLADISSIMHSFFIRSGVRAVEGPQ